MNTTPKIAMQPLINDPLPNHALTVHPLVNGLRVKALSLCVLASLLAGCANTSNKETILPQTGPTMKQVYDRHFSGGGQYQSAEQVQNAGGEDLQSTHANDTFRQEHTRPIGNVRRVGDGVRDLKGYTRESYNETQLVFGRLPNPDLVLYVFPHLSGTEGSPIPGYTTAFSFYEHVEYALPGEVGDQ